MGERLTNLLASRPVPKPGRAILAAAEDSFAIAAESDGQDLVIMVQDRAQGPARGCLPQMHRPIRTSRHEGLAVGAEGHGVDGALVGEGAAERVDLTMP